MGEMLQVTHKSLIMNNVLLRLNKIAVLALCSGMCVNVKDRLCYVVVVVVIVVVLSFHSPVKRQDKFDFSF